MHFVEGKGKAAILAGPAIQADLRSKLIAIIETV